MLRTKVQSYLTQLTTDTENLKEAGLFKSERLITSAL